MTCTVRNELDTGETERLEPDTCSETADLSLSLIEMLRHIQPTTPTGLPLENIINIIKPFYELIK